jgi:hypothetical protein
MIIFIKELIRHFSFSPLERWMKRDSKMVSGSLMILVTLLGGGKGIYEWLSHPGLPMTEGKLQPPVQEEIKSTGGYEESVLDGNWSQYNTFLKDGYFYIEDNTDNARLEHEADIDLLSMNVEFVPVGEYAINLEFSRRNLYKIVVGDNSYNAIGFNSRIDHEKWSSYNRRYMNVCKFSATDPVSFNLRENYLDKENTFEIKLTIYCESGKDEEIFVFTPPPNWKEFKRIYFGLIDSQEGAVNSTGFYFVSPRIVDKLETK